MKQLITIYITLIFTALCIHQGSSQGVLVEEFTNLGTVNYSQSHAWIDSLQAENPLSTFCVIKYHTDFPSVDTFNTDVNVDVNKRLNALGGISELATAVVDGEFRAQGNYFTGSTLNLTRDQLDSIKTTKPKDISFFGLKMNFSPDFQTVYGSSGMSLLNGNTDLPVHHYQVLVEEVVNTMEPIGPDGETQFTNVFRGFITYRQFNNIPGNGSTHGWGSLDIPASVVNLSNLKMVVFITHLDGRVIDCTSIKAGAVDPYKIRVTNASTNWSKYCDSIVEPKVSVTNVGPKDITGLSISANVDGQKTTMYIDTIIKPNQAMTFSFDLDTLSPGRHLIDTDVDYVVDAINSAVIEKTNGAKRYLISGIFDKPDQGFEDLPADEIGHFMVRSQTDLAFKKINAADLGHDQKLGAYGKSDHSLMVDQWNWDWDETDAGNVFLRDNKNFGFLLYNSFDLSSIKFPVLYFDVAAATRPNHRCLEVGISGNPCGNDYRVVKSFFCNQLNTAPQNITSMFIPDTTQWQTMSVSLEGYSDYENAQLRFWTSNHVDFTYPNAFYIDNIRVMSTAKECVSGDIKLKTQAEVDSFTALMDECNIQFGNICIGYCDGDSLTSDITDLSGFSSLKELGGSLSIAQNPMLKSVRGFQNLRHIGGDVIIYKNDSLISLADLKLTKYTGGSIRVIDNRQLDTMLSFHQDKPIMGDFIVKGNPNLNYFWIGGLTGIDGNCILHDLTEVKTFGSSNTSIAYVGGDLSIQNNKNLRSVTVFRLLSRIPGNFILKDNPALSSIGFYEQTIIGGDLVLEGLDTLEQLNLWRLDSLGGNLTIKNNKNLMDIASLDILNYDYFNSIKEDSIYLILEDNPNLSHCQSDLVCRLLEDLDRAVLIEDNGMGCKNEMDVKEACVSGIETVDVTVNFAILPNPTFDMIWVSSTKDPVTSVEIFHPNGQLLQSHVYQLSDGINLGQLNPGVYMVRINFTHMQKVLKF